MNALQLKTLWLGLLCLAASISASLLTVWALSQWLGWSFHPAAVVVSSVAICAAAGATHRRRNPAPSAAPQSPGRTRR